MLFLRSVSLEDSGVLTEIHNASFSYHWELSSFRNMLMDPAFFGFIIGQEVKGKKVDCGFILCRRVLEEIEIITFCVLPFYRKLGFGKLLLGEMLKKAGLLLKDETNSISSMKIFLEVAQNNSPAINLYKIFGFEQISKRPKYYRTPDGSVDAHIMVLKLNEEDRYFK